MVKKISDLYLDARRALLTREEPETAAFLSRHLLAHVTGKNQAQLLSDKEQYVGDEVCQAMEAGVARLLEGEPLAYVLGEWDFYGNSIN